VNGRTILAVVLALLLTVGAAAIGVSIYNAGIAQGAAQAAAGTGSTVVVPAYGWGWGWGGWGFGGLFFGFFGFLFLLFVIGAIFRLAFGWGRRGGRRGWGYGPGYGPGGWGGSGGQGSPSGAGPDAFRGSPWEARARQIHDEWHRGQAEAGPTTGSTDPGASAG